MLPPPPGAADRWRSGCRALLPEDQPPLTLADFNDRCRAATAAANERRRAAGEPFPEVSWPDIIRDVLPSRPGPETAAALSSLHAACSRTCVPMPGAFAALARYRAAGVLLGIASNAQDYTRTEFTGAGFHLSSFDPGLIFLSGDHGFAKPSPRVFALLTGKLAARGIAPHEILMAGDRPDNDLAPAAAAGWQTRLITAAGW